MWLIPTFCVTALAVGACAKEVCYPEVGCFSNDPPWDNADGLLPLAPGGMPLHILIYTRQSRLSIRYNDSNVVQKLSNAQVDLAKPTIFILHGFGGDTKTASWMFDIKDALLTKADFNVLIVIWAKAAEMPNYAQAVANTRVVAAQIQILLESLQEGGLRLSSTYLIGHSLGAQISANIGRRMDGKIGRITALDPAGVSFEGKSTDVRIDPTDANFVDVIHTDGSVDGKMSIRYAGMGMMQPAGHVDFYVNGGQDQPGCFDYVTGTFRLRKRSGEDPFGFYGCSHHRCIWEYIESINSECKFTSYPCSSYTRFKRGYCRDCSNNGCNDMGFPASPNKGRGVLYLTTKTQPPFCVKTTSLPSLLS